jgi:RNA polymerase sigma-70 factor (ECF subfamily)
MGADSKVERMFLEGQRKWPFVKLTFAVFEAHYQRVIAADRSLEPEEAADLYLCCACSAGEREALAAFEREGLEVAKAAIARIDRDPDFVQETLQEIWDKLLLGPNAKVADYSGRGPLLAWVRVAATRTALDRCRARTARADRQLEHSDNFAARDPNPELSLAREQYGEAFQQALRHAVTALSSQERNVLRMHLTGQCSIDEIGRAYGVHRATAARWLERTRERIYESVRSQLSAQNPRLTDSEFKSLARGLGSQLALSLSAHSLALSGSHSLSTKVREGSRSDA